MEFEFSFTKLFPSDITVWDSHFLRKLTPTQHDQFRSVVDAVGDASCKAQALKAVITTASKLRYSDHRLYILVDPQHRLALAILRVGKKKLFIRNEFGQLKEIDPLCVLDFYVHESKQRSGLGKYLFDYMLENEGVAAAKLGYDRPSPKLIGFLAKHFGLKDFIPQENHFVVFKKYFELPDPRKKEPVIGARSPGHVCRFPSESVCDSAMIEAIADSAARKASDRPPHDDDTLRSQFRLPPQAEAFNDPPVPSGDPAYHHNDMTPPSFPDRNHVSASEPTTPPVPTYTAPLPPREHTCALPSRRMSARPWANQNAVPPYTHTDTRTASTSTCAPTCPRDSLHSPAAALRTSRSDLGVCVAHVAEEHSSRPLGDGAGYGGPGRPHSWVDNQQQRTASASSWRNFSSFPAPHRASPLPPPQRHQHLHLVEDPSFQPASQGKSGSHRESALPALNAALPWQTGRPNGSCGTVHKALSHLQDSPPLSKADTLRRFYFTNPAAAAPPDARHLHPARLRQRPFWFGS